LKNRQRRRVHVSKGASEGRKRSEKRKKEKSSVVKIQNYKKKKKNCKEEAIWKECLERGGLELKKLHV